MLQVAAFREGTGPSPTTCTGSYVGTTFMVVRLGDAARLGEATRASPTYEHPPVAVLLEESCQFLFGELFLSLAPYLD